MRVKAGRLGETQQNIIIKNILYPTRGHAPVFVVW